MVAPNFLLTNSLLIQPISSLSQQNESCIEYLVFSQGLTRVLGLCISLTAAVDTLIHLGVFLGKGGYNLIAYCCGSEGYADTGAHFDNVIKYGLLTLFGSLVGIIYPAAFISAPAEAPPGALSFSAPPLLARLDEWPIEQEDSISVDPSDYSIVPEETASITQLSLQVNPRGAQLAGLVKGKSTLL